MHLTRELLWFVIGLLAGGLGGTVLGFCLFAAWTLGWLFPVPSSLAKGDTTVRNQPDFAGSKEYLFRRDDIGNVTYQKIPYAGDGEG